MRVLSRLTSSHDLSSQWNPIHFILQVCTLIGTSTNFIVLGLLMDRYPANLDLQNMSLFAITPYGVPVALVGVAYVLLATPLLLDRKNRRGGADTNINNNIDDILLGARLTQWSPAAGRTIRRSGLRDTGGIYLVSVRRSATGNLHTAVSPEFVLEVNDILYFTGMFETFGDFCEEHGLEVMTSEVELMDCNIRNTPPASPLGAIIEEVPSLEETVSVGSNANLVPSPQCTSRVNSLTSPLVGTVGTRQSKENIQNLDITLDNRPQVGNDNRNLDTLGITLDTLLDATHQERMRVIFSIEDAIRGDGSTYQTTLPSSTFRIVVAAQEEQDLVILAVDGPDRPGLLLDISKCLVRLKLDARHTEAAVRGIRSLSIWRCKVVSTETITDLNVSAIYTTTQMLFATSSGPEAIRQRGLQVIRAHIRDGSRLVGKSLSDVSNFRDVYKAAVVSIQSNNDDRVQHESFLSTVFEVGDLLVLQVNDDSPLLESPPEGFYLHDESKRSSSIMSLFSSGSSPKMIRRNSDKFTDEDVEKSNGLKAKEAVWNDLEVFSANSNGNAGVQREFLIAMTVPKGSDLIGKTVAQGGVDNLPGLFLVSIDLDRHCIVPGSDPPVEAFLTVPFTEVLTEGDLLWFSGSASSVGELRKVPGLALYESGEVMQVNERVQDRRLVEAVVSRKGPLVGKTVKEVNFRTKYGAAVISVHREGRRVHELPGNIKLHAGDVLLLEAGKSFIVANKNQYDDAFTLMAEVEGSSPPRFRMLIPAVVLTVSAYATYMAKLSSLFGTTLAAAILMVMLGVLTEEEARASIRWEIYLTIAPAYGIGSALINSGVALSMSSFLVKVGNSMGIGNAGVLGSVYLSTVLMSQMIANNAAAALIFPIAMGAAENGGIDVVLMSFGIMLAASAAFMTPFGYQTNLMVMGPGGYTTSDYLIFGTPMQVVLTVISTWALVEKQWLLVWLVSGSILAAVCMFLVVRDRKNSKGKRA